MDILRFGGSGSGSTVVFDALQQRETFLYDGVGRVEVGRSVSVDGIQNPVVLILESMWKGKLEL